MRQVLCLDGGGVRGVFTATILKNLQKELPQNMRIYDFFKGRITGTSAGSMIAAALTVPRHKVNGEFVEGPYEPKEIADFFEEMGEKVFGAEVAKG